MAKEGKDKGKVEKKSTIARYYTVKDGKVSRRNTWCPKCGPGIFLAMHEDRLSCGKCGYSEFKKAAGK